MVNHHTNLHFPKKHVPSLVFLLRIQKKSPKAHPYKKELNKIIISSKKEGMTVIPLLLYFTDRGIAKLSIGIGKGKKKYDKRLSIKAKEWGIKKQRLIKNRSI